MVTVNPQPLFVVRSSYLCLQSLFARSSKSLSAVIWTTTPWTLVANRAVCYNPQLKYSIVTLSNMGQELYLVGSGLIEGLEKTLGVEIQRHFEFEGKIFLLTGFNYTLQKLLTVMFIIYCVCKIPSV